MDFLDRLRALPGDSKKRYAFFAALIVTSIIALMWAIALPARFEETVTTSDSTAPGDSQDTVPELIEEGKNQIGSVIDSVLENAPAIPTEIPDTRTATVATSTPTTTSVVRTDSDFSSTTTQGTSTVKTIALPVQKVETRGVGAASGTAIIKIATTSIQKSE